jgi:hypothetical protein
VVLNISRYRALGALLVLVVVLFAAPSAVAQKVKSFSKNKADYSAELTDFLKEIEKEKPKWEALSLEFTGKLNSDLFSDNAFSDIVDISNNLLKKRIVDFETWNYFLRSTVLLHENEDPKHAEPWLNDLVVFSKKERNGTIAIYLRAMFQGLSEQVLFNDGTLKWKSPDATWIFSWNGEPNFTITDADLWGYFKADSTVIEGTRGIYNPKTLKFVGQGGTAYWVRTGLSRDSAYAELSNYNLSVDRQDFTADSVVLHSKLYLKDPLIGRFEERLSSRSEEKNASFPRFTSYRQDLELREVYPNVDFVGGISVIGRKYYGSGTPANKATLFFNFEGKPVLKAKSERIWFREDILTSDATQVTIKLDEDSIYHPKSALRFIPAQNQLTLNRDKEGLSLSPYSDTYHDLDIFFDVMSWKLNEPQMHLGNLNLGAVSPVIFESQNYYRGELMDQIKGLDQEVGPLRNIAKVCDMYGRKNMSLDEMAKGLHMQKESAHRFMLQMSIGGFVNYDQASENIVVKDKLFDYIQNERGKRDYDVIRFISGLESGANASISLLNFDMDIRGISAIALSDSQEVALYPKQKNITVHEGLNFDFDGRITAGRFSFWGSQFFFDYNNFQMNMPTIDSMRFKVVSFEQDVNGNRWLVDVKNVLQNLTGELLIDKGNNKSGRVRYTEYPIFRSGKDSYVYYDRKSIFNSVYNREKFFVTLEPFEIDSLDNTSTQGLKFAGVLTSAGIFPDIAEDIMVQKDYSLGFETATPEGGYPGYGGKGRYTGAISLSNKGFQGDGNIKYLTSTAVSNSLLFFPDSTNGAVQTYEILPQLAGVEYPHVTASNVNMNWRPYQDVFYTTSTTTPFAMYDDVGMQARGTLAMAPTKLGGKGMLDFLDAQTTSQDYVFKNRQFDSPAMAFKVRANPTAEWGFSLQNARGFVNFDREKGEFTVNDSASYISFPINQYIAYMDFAEWRIPQKSIEVKKLGAAALSHMVSVHPKQDSLQFMAGSAKFSLIPSLLEGFGIPKIEVADADILPDTGYVAIEPAALMRTLTHAQIIANRTQKFHKFYEATVNIKARNNYRGAGILDYLDEDQTPWPLFFESIKPDTSLTTVGLANVKVEDNFYLSAFFGYYGKVNLRATDKSMLFDGYTLIQHQCDNIQTTWFKFQSVIDPMKIVITLPEDKTGPNRLFNGIYLAPDSTSGYSAFLSQDNSKADQEIISSTGVLYYDKDIYSYVVTSPEKVIDPRAPGNYLALNNRDCYTTGKGSLGFADKTGQIELQSYGIVTHQLNNDAMVLDMVLGFEFYFDEDILKDIAKRIKDATSLKASDNSREAYKVAIDNLLTGKEKEKYEEEVSLFGAPDRVPRAMRKTINFSELVLEFNPETNSFISSGDIGVGSIVGEQLNKKMPGIVEIARKRRGDEISIYLEIGGGDYIFFQYRRNIMQFYSTDKAIMDKLLALDTDKRSLKAKEGKPPYTYNSGSKGKVRLFLDRFE